DFLSQNPGYFRAIGATSTPAASKAAPAKAETAKPTKLSYKDQRRLQELDSAIAALPGKIKKLETDLADPGLYARDIAAFDKINKTLEASRKELSAAEEEWLALEERREALKRLKGVENRTWVRVAGFEPVRPHVDEDLEREDEEKTSAVHFMRFELTPEMVKAVKQGAAIAMGIDHPAYTHQTDSIPPATRDSLARDLSS
ncbi:MAG: DUF3501 family protein, partial [Deltaproteobacteria bacterium]